MEYNCIWEYLSKAEKPIVMYGMGNGADKILEVCSKYKIEIKDFFASDGFVRGHSFHNKKVLSYSQIKEKYGQGNFIVILSFATSLPDVIDNIKRISEESELYSTDVPVHGNQLFDWDFFVSNKTKIQEARELFSDEESKIVYDNIIKYKLSGNIGYLFEADSEKDDAYMNILHADKFEYIADLGAYNGDTARELAKYDNNIKEIIAFEPDMRNFKKLEKYAESENKFKVVPYQLAAWNQKQELTFGSEGNRNSGIDVNFKENSKSIKIYGNSLDNIVSESGISRIDYIKFDVEGAENEALEGCYKTIEKFSPNMLISAYHKSEDIFALPIKLHEKFPNYKLYLRKFRYIPAWDLNLYAVN